MAVMTLSFLRQHTFDDWVNLPGQLTRVGGRLLLLFSRGGRALARRELSRRFLYALDNLHRRSLGGGRRLGVRGGACGCRSRLLPGARAWLARLAGAAGSFRGAAVQGGHLQGRAQVSRPGRGRGRSCGFRPGGENARFRCG